MTKQVRPFIDTLRDIRKGLCLDDLDNKLNELIQAVKETNKGGTITFTLAVKPINKGDASTVSLIDNITLKRPVPDKAITIMFTTDENNLQRSDPRQQSFPLKPVDSSHKDQTEESEAGNA